MTDLTDLTVAAIRAGVAAGQFKAAEVAEAFNANVAAASALNAFIVATPEKALEAAAMSVARLVASRDGSLAAIVAGKEGEARS